MTKANATSFEAEIKTQQTRLVDLSRIIAHLIQDHIDKPCA